MAAEIVLGPGVAAFPVVFHALPTKAMAWQ